MATMVEIHAGLAILLKYEAEGEVSAEHDEVYAGRTPPEALTAEDRAGLEIHGWHWDEKYESWRRFT